MVFCVRYNFHYCLAWYTIISNPYSILRFFSPIHPDSVVLLPSPQIDTSTNFLASVHKSECLAFSSSVFLIYAALFSTSYFVLSLYFPNGNNFMLYIYSSRYLHRILKCFICLILELISSKLISYLNEYILIWSVLLPLNRKINEVSQSPS